MGGLGGLGLWDELRAGREAWLETGPCMGRARLPAVLVDESLSGALLWKTEAAEIEKVTPRPTKAGQRSRELDKNFGAGVGGGGGGGGGSETRWSVKLAWRVVPHRPLPRNGRGRPLIFRSGWRSRDLMARGRVSSSSDSPARARLLSVAFAPDHDGPVFERLMPSRGCVPCRRSSCRRRAHHGSSPVTARGSR